MASNKQNPMNEPRYCGIPTFMRTPHATDLNNLDIALVGVPYDGAVEARSGGPAGAPADKRHVQYDAVHPSCYEN